jgi:glutamate-1-semialdehyde 2,1-aminomutase
MMDPVVSRRLLEEAVKVTPGGVNSPVRAFKSVDMWPRFIKSANGARLYDEDGEEFIDYVCSWGPMILGHCEPEVTEKVREALAKGASFGAPTRAEVEMAVIICEMVPSIEMVRMVNSGTEATMSAIRLARGYTGKDKILKFSGCYHGHSDSLLAKAGSGAATFSTPDSMGVPGDTVKGTLIAQYNNIDEVRSLMEANKGQVGALIVEPVAGNMGVVPPQEGFLKGLRDICDENESLLIFDEVMSGFRVAPGGAQELYGVTPDLTCLGKIIGGGLPVGAFGGKREIMELLAPVGGVYQAGTLSGNPLAMAAGLTTLKILQRENPYPELERKSARLEEGVAGVLNEKGIPHWINRVGSMLSVFFNPGPVRNYEQAALSDKETFKSFFSNMMARGIYLAASPFEAWFVSVAHKEEDIERTIEAVKTSV